MTAAKLPITDSAIDILRGRIDTINTLLNEMRADQFGGEIYQETRYGVAGPAAFRYTGLYEDHHAAAASHLAAALKAAQDALAPLLTLAKMAGDAHRRNGGRR